MNDFSKIKKHVHNLCDTHFKLIESENDHDQLRRIIMSFSDSLGLAADLVPQDPIPEIEAPLQRRTKKKAEKNAK